MTATFYVLLSTANRKTVSKQQKLEQKAPITFARIATSLGKGKAKTIRVLLDSGASSSIIYKPLVNKLRIRQTAPTEWNTAAGLFTMSQKTVIRFMLPELHEKRIIEYKVHVTDTESRYDMIMGRDLLSTLGITLNFQNESIIWDETVIPMKDMDATVETAYHIEDSASMQEAMARIKKILDAKYEPAGLTEIASSCTHLTPDERDKLYALLKKYESLFDGSLGHWRGEQYKIEVKKGAQPYHARSYPIPKAYEQTLRMEVDRLVREGVLKKVNRSEWAAPTFIVPKKDGSVRFISDFRELNKRITRKPYPIPKIQDLMLKLEGFKYGTSLDLNMGYYHIELDPYSKKLCTIVLPLGKYEYQRLPMGLCNSPDIFQEKMSLLMQGLEYVRAYIDDLPVYHMWNMGRPPRKTQSSISTIKRGRTEGQCQEVLLWTSRTGVPGILDNSRRNPTSTKESGGDPKYCHTQNN